MTSYDTDYENLREAFTLAEVLDDIVEGVLIVECFDVYGEHPILLNFNFSDDGELLGVSYEHR